MCVLLNSRLPVRTSEATLRVPNTGPIHRATVLTKDGRIVAVGSQVQIPLGYEVIRCEGCAIVAGFWNSHVHFTEPKWDAADKQPAQKLSDQLQWMLTRSGFTTVVDTGSLLANMIALRRRIDSGNVLGPRILTAGVPIYPPDGVIRHRWENSLKVIR
jgi:imidazolonepropionase-like amidohydrolase